MSFPGKVIHRHVIYWAGDELRIAVIAREGDQAVIVQHAVFDIRVPSGELQAALRDFLKKTNTAHELWIPVVPQSNVLWKWITVPSHNEEEIFKMVRLSMRTMVWDHAEFIFDHQIMEKHPDGRSKVRVGVIHQDVLEKYWDLLRAAGIRFERWGVSSMVVKSLSHTMLGV